MDLEVKNIRQIRVILTEILIILANKRKIGNISVNITRICLIFCTSEQIFLRIHREYFYNFIYFTYKILRVTCRYLRHKILNLYLRIVIVAGNPGVFQAYPYPYPPNPLPPPRVGVLTGRGLGYGGFGGVNGLTSTRQPANIDYTYRN